MKALTLTQPWATLVTIGAKKIETRSWGTNYRGSLAIHAAKTFPKSLHAEVAQNAYIMQALHAAGLHVGPFKNPHLPMGAVVAIVELVHIKQMDVIHTFPACKSYIWRGREWPLDDEERAFGNYQPGRYMWLLGPDVKQLPEPIPARGSLGLWNWDDPK